MRLTTLNLNKRCATLSGRERLGAWLQSREIDVLLAQEVSLRALASYDVTSYEAVGGSEDLYVWVRPGMQHPAWTLVAPWVLRLAWGAENAVYVVHLDHNSTRRRADQLTELRERLVVDPAGTVVVTGDFNLAPADVDGRFGDEASTWNNATDRGPFRQLLAARGLVDLGHFEEAPEFTFSRISYGRVSRFRCDLVLVSQGLASQAHLTYDHTTREPQTGFTDHSAVLVDLPLVLSGAP